MVCGISILNEKEVLTFGACLSIFCHLIVFFLFYYVNIPNLRRHPTSKRLLFILLSHFLITLL